MDAKTIRSAFLSAIPQQFDRMPELKFVYFPIKHLRALDPEVPLVRGIRGAGKSVFWEVHQLPTWNKYLSLFFPRYPASLDVKVTPGYGENSQPDRYPDKDTLAALLLKHPARLIWRTVIVWHISDSLPNLNRWSDRVDWLVQNAESTAEMIHSADEKLFAKNGMHQIVFDALDRTADTWDQRAQLLDGLLQNLLEFRTTHCIRAKAFVRPDMLIGHEIGRFPDASKILANPAELRWPRAELFGLLWQYLGNASTGGREFRALIQSASGAPPKHNYQYDVFDMPQSMNANESLQRQVFHQIAGEWMGNDVRRGSPYTWLPNHLADGSDQVSPRSFLAALREAAELTHQRYPEHSTPLRYDAIKQGVQKASQIRVQEATEDLPWLMEVMKPLKHQVVPCDIVAIEQLWKDDQLSTRLSKELRGVLPSRANHFAAGLVEQLKALGIFTMMPNSRINMPDVYRVGFGLGRRGGIKPLR